MFYLIRKEKNISSFAAITNFAKNNKIIKIGHSGTLDPLATGCLLLGSDDDAKLFTFIKNKTKKYHVESQLGFQTDTFDITGMVVNKTTKKCFSLEEIMNSIEKIKKVDFQKPPIFSAKKVNGKRAYDLARGNVKFTLPNIQIKIFSIENVDFDVENQILKFDIHVSNGTYIRSIVNDLGNELGTYATMTNLDRYEISGISFGISHKEIIKKLFKNNIILTNKKDVIELQKNHFNYVCKLDWYKKIINKNDDYILVDKDKYEVYGIINITDGFIKVKKLFGKRLQ
ncbi:tRNA pseudouridine(55) synthase TruB [Mycoplasma elephantis]|uniref:tRNA pseudouridine(55) synthase TruB n=1 Tax=Mycoplasma elephantis TaxID=114882 RepID=UPI0004866CFA|nr:tRNA pseudouridine(55) synthase TruB [Mycoplasma elephantis]